MRRKLFNFAAACSMLVCLATILLWLRSYALADAVGYAGRFQSGEVSFVNGRLHFWHWTTNDTSWAANAWWPGWRYIAPDPAGSWAYRLPGGTITFSFTLAGTNCFRYSLSRGASADTIPFTVATLTGWHMIIAYRRTHLVQSNDFHYATKDFDPSTGTWSGWSDKNGASNAANLNDPYNAYDGFLSHYLINRAPRDSRATP